MGDIFASAPGTVAVFPQDFVLPGRIKIANHEPQGFLISGSDHQQRTEQQFQSSLERAVYIYVFGDAMGNVTVRGKAFIMTCDGASEGLAEILDLYSQNRASVKADPIDISIGSKVISGFLTELRVRSTVLSEDPIGLAYDFDLVVNALPEKQP